MNLFVVVVSNFYNACNGVIMFPHESGPVGGSDSEKSRVDPLKLCIRDKIGSHGDNVAHIALMVVNGSQFNRIIGKI